MKIKDCDRVAPIAHHWSPFDGVAGSALILIEDETIQRREFRYDAARGLFRVTFGNLRQNGRIMVEPPSIRHMETVSFGEKLAVSAQFLTLFNEGMDLVAEAAAYLDGEGRTDARQLTSAGALGYAVESMRLTTRLMQIASWLLLQRAVNEGELTRAEAAAEKRRIRLSGQNVVSSEDVLALLPLRLCALIEMSLRLQARIIHLDALFYRSTSRRGRQTPPPSPVGSQIDRLKRAFAPAAMGSIP